MSISPVNSNVYYATTDFTQEQTQQQITESEVNDDFYNNPRFISNELGFLSTQVSQDEQAWQRGQDQIKQANEIII
jgi:hypothetical protein